MKLLIRADASIEIGVGHIMRTLVIAKSLQQYGFLCSYICSQLTESMRDLLFRNQIEVIDIEGSSNELDDAKQTVSAIGSESYSLLIVGHYRLGAEWESYLNSHINRILVVDDLANRSHACHELLDQNLVDGYLSRYDNLVPVDCVQYLGPSFALLDESFRKLSESVLPRDGTLKRILVCLGGTDPANETPKVIKSFDFLPTSLSLHVDVVVGASNPNREMIANNCSTRGLVFHQQIGNMAELMAKADLFVGSGGIVTWERSSLGLPGIAVAIASNQIAGLSELQRQNASIYLGQSNMTTPQQYAEAILGLANNPLQLNQMSRNSLKMMTGHAENYHMLINRLAKGGYMHE